MACCLLCFRYGWVQNRPHGVGLAHLFDRREQGEQDLQQQGFSSAVNLDVVAEIRGQELAGQFPSAPEHGDR